MPAISFASVWPLCAIVALPLIWWLAWRHRSGLDRRRVALAALVRSGALVLIVLALMSPTLHRGIRDFSVVFAIDISDSVSPAFLGDALAWISDVDARYKPEQVRFVVFADGARLLTRADDIIPANDLAGALGRGATNLEQGLITSLYGFAPDHAKRLVVVTDGNQTDGDLWRAVPRMQVEGVRVFTIPASVAVETDAWVESVMAPEGTRVQQPIAIKVRVFSRSAVRARVELRSVDKNLGSRNVTLVAGENDVSFQTKLERSGANTITAQVFADADQISRNDTLSETLWVRPRPQVLYVENNPASAHYLADALIRQGIGVTVATPAQLSSDQSLLKGKEVAILSDVPAQAITSETGRSLETFVRDQGGGLIFVSGENTFGKAGFANSDVERLLPVKFEGRRKRKDLDLVLLIDRSYSMRGRKLELAKSAALATLDLLEEEHRLAVVAFDSKPHDVVPLAAVGTKRRAEDLISSMTSSGQTNIYTGLLYAQHLLKDSSAKTKHIILLSDGDTAPPPGTAGEKLASADSMALIRRVREDVMRRERGVIEPEEVDAPAKGGFQELVAELAADNVTLSTVAIGDKPNLDLMGGLAKWANGKSYVAKNDAEIPGLFVAEARRLLGESIVEEPFRPIVKGRNPAVEGVDFAAGPELRGFVVARPKRFSEVLLEAKKDQPLLVETHYGLGKTVAFLSDAKNRWAADWLSWEGYGRLWAQVVRQAMRQDAGEGLQWRVTRQGRDAVLTLSALTADGAYRNGLSPKVRVVSPTGDSTVAVLRQVAPGFYRTRLPLHKPSDVPFRFELVESPGLSKQEAAQTGARSLFYPYSDEYRVAAPNIELLKTLSQQTGGKFAPTADEIFADLGEGGTTSKALWQYFAGAALALFLLDILVRRAPWVSRRRL